MARGQHNGDGFVVRDNGGVWQQGDRLVSVRVGGTQERGADEQQEDGSQGYCSTAFRKPRPTRLVLLVDVPRTIPGAPPCDTGAQRVTRRDAAMSRRDNVMTTPLLENCPARVGTAIGREGPPTPRPTAVTWELEPVP